MRSGKLIAKNDHLIEKLLKDSRYKVLESGVILKNNRPVGSKDREGYLRVFYGENKRVFGHRIVYAAFNGSLKEDLVVDHKDGCTFNNSSDNLILVTQKKNIEYKNRRRERTKK